MPNCDICRNELSPFFKYDEAYEYYQCPKCFFLKRIPEDQKIDYVDGYTDQNLILKSRIAARDYYRKSEKFIKARSKILEIGGGLSFFGNLLQEKKECTVYSYEKSKFALDFSKRVNNVIPVNDLSSLANEQFDVICSFHVLEHIEPKEFSTFISNIKQKLKKNGALILFTPNGNAFFIKQLKKNSPVICFPQHISFFTSQSAKIWLEQNNFTIMKSSTKALSSIHYPIFSLGYFLYSKLGKNQQEKIKIFYRNNQESKKIKIIRQFFRSGIFMEQLLLSPFYYLAQYFVKEKDELIIAAQKK